MNKITGVSLTESVSESSQEPPIIHADDPSQTTESPLEKGPSIFSSKKLLDSKYVSTLGTSKS